MKKVVKSNYQKVYAPTAFVTQSRQRVKQYDNNTVFLNDGDEFEIELFNPTNEKILAKIYLNGNALDSGIILRPGERIFLERYLDESRKFLFETYNVDPNDPNVNNAIKDNGLVEVEFYKKYECYYWTNTYTVNVSDDWYRGPVYTYTTNDVEFSNHTLTGTGDIGSRDNVAYSCSDEKHVESNISESMCNTMETGRVEKGSHSNQSFEYDHTSFNSYYTWKRTWKILPKSRKAIMKEDLKVFCTNCGAKRKKDSFKFCPHCGNKF